jgi:hypothetical protein
MRGNTFLRTVTILGLGIAGLVGGHALGYALAFPDPQHRTMALAGAGHGYMPSASWLALVLGIAAVVTGVAAGRLQRSRSHHLEFKPVASRIVALQCAGFVSLEVVERLVSGGSMRSLSIGLLAVGLLAQVVCALVLALVIVGLRRIGARLTRRTLVVAAPLRGGAVRLVAVRFCLRPLERLRVRGPPAAAAR